MKEIILNKPFVNLPKINLTSVASFSLVSKFYEKEMAMRNGGIDLNSSESIKKITDNDEKHYKSLAPMFITGVKRTPDSMHNILKKYKNISGPCSMIINSLEGLEKHILRAYQVSYANYILGKKNNINGNFPSKSCGISGLNVMFSLMEHGYPNAAYSSNQNHCYTLLPFIMKGSQEKIDGTIIIDPTSDQLWSSLDEKPRNLVSVILGDKWEYKTDLKECEDLFPETIANLDNLRHLFELQLPYTKQSYFSGREYLRKAFSNPIDISDYFP